MLDFNDRCQMSSVKNFQLVDNQNDEYVYMQMGKVKKDQFNLDVAFPFSVYQAVAVAMSSLDFKIAVQ